VLWEKVEGAFVKLTVDPEGSVYMYLYVPPGYNLNMSGLDGAEIKVNTAQRIEGTVNLNDTDSDGPRALKLTFAADMGDTAATVGTATAATAAATVPKAEAPSGELLPAGGGKRGKVFQQALKAQRAGDVDTMLKLSDKETRERMLAERDKPEFAQMIEMMKQMSPAEVAVTGGRVNDSTATVEFNGRYIGGGTSTGTATLLKEDGRWVLQKVNENLHSP